MTFKLNQHWFEGNLFSSHPLYQKNIIFLVVKRRAPRTSFVPATGAATCGAKRSQQSTDWGDEQTLREVLCERIHFGAAIDDEKDKKSKRLNE